MATRDRRALIILTHAFVGWALCAATIGIGQAIFSLHGALILHAIGAPIYFFAVTRFYFARYAYTTALRTALAFIAFVMLVDFFLVGLVINRSLEMFASPLGTWIPFALIFASTWLTGYFSVPAGARHAPA